MGRRSWEIISWVTTSDRPGIFLEAENPATSAYTSRQGVYGTSAQGYEEAAEVRKVEERQ